MRKILLFLFPLLLLMSCENKKQKNDLNVLDISFGQMSTVSPMDIMNTSFIKLETTDSCLINSIGMMTSIDNFLLVLDDRNLNLYVFDKEGNYLTKVGRRGNGPGEYVDAQSFFVNKKEIGVIDVAQEKILYYSIPDFKFISEIKLPVEISCCEILKDESAVCSSASYDENEFGNHYFIVADSLYKPIRTTVEKKFKSGYMTGTSKMIYKVDDKVFAYSPFVSDVYEISKDKTEIAFRLSFGDHEMPPHEFLMEKSNGGKSSYFDALEKSNYISYYEISEVPDYMSVFYIVNNQRYIGFYDKRNKKTYTYKQELFQEQLEVNEAFTYFAGMLGNCCAAPLDINDLIDLKNNGYKLPVELSELVQKSKPDDNPIILTVSLK